MNIVFILTRDSKFLGVFTSIKKVKDFIKNENLSLFELLLEEFTFANTTFKKDVTELLFESAMYKHTTNDDFNYKFTECDFCGGENCRDYCVNMNLDDYC
jgi:hypothetical protein